MRIFFFYLFLNFLSINIFSQTLIENRSPKVFYTVADVINYKKQDIRQCHYNPFKERIVVKLCDGTRESIKVDSLWGYQPRNDDPVRVFHKELYRISKIKTIGATVFLIYYKYFYKSSIFYFSTSYGGEIYKLSQKNMKNHLSTTEYNQFINDRYIKHRIQW